jgi:hypothetical protein
MAVLVFLDGVLRNKKNAPIPNGMLLYRSLNETNRVLILCKDKEKDNNWLKQNKIFKLDDLVDQNLTYLGDNPEYRQVEYVRGLGPVDYVITENPELAALLLQQGITALVFLNPLYIDDRYRPDSLTKKSWDEVIQELDKQEEALLEDPRVNG